MNYAQLVAFADNLTAVCPVDKDGNTSHAVIRHAIMEHPHFFPYLNPKTELQAEEAECVSMSLDKAGVPTEEGGKPLSLWGRVLHFAGKANANYPETPTKKP